MNVVVQRFSDGGDSTIGLFFISGKFEGYTIEDEHRNVKVYGETRIPAGGYEILYRVEPDSKMNQQYQRAYPDWFKWHLWLQSVPNYTYIYLHEGVTDDNTDGCILVGDAANNNVMSVGRLARSPQAFKRIYLKISAALDAGERVFITVQDEDDYVR